MKQEITFKKNTLTMVWDKEGVIYAKGIYLDKEDYIPRQLYLLNQSVIRTMRKIGDIKIKSNIECEMNGKMKSIEFFIKEGRCVICDKEISPSREMTHLKCEGCYEG